MLVRLKKRGKLPTGCGQELEPVLNGAEVISAYRGMTIEVEATGFNWSCGGNEFEVVDGRIAPLFKGLDDGEFPCICEHYLIDDLDAYESDYCDEQAGIGDIAFAPLVSELAELKR
jgi:hypothetical protein